MQTAQVQGQYNQAIGTERDIIALIGDGRQVVQRAPMASTQQVGQEALAGIVVPGNNLNQKFTWLDGNAESNNTYVLVISNNESIAPHAFEFRNMRNITIVLRGDTPNRTISLSTNGSLFTVGANIELILEDIVLQGRRNNNAPLIRVHNGNIVLNNGSNIIGNTFVTATENTGGAGVFLNSGDMLITGGIVSGNTVSSSANGTGGGGIFAVNGSTIRITDGAIRNNQVNSNRPGDYAGSEGGGIFLQNSHLEMSGGVIEGNSINDRGLRLNSTAHGGGISSRTFFHFSVGTIRNNTVTSNATVNFGGSFGGGVYFSGEFIMTGGIISGNRVVSHVNPNYHYWTNNMFSEGGFGGGVASRWLPNSFTKTGGTIYGNDVPGNDSDGFPLRNVAQNDRNGIGGGHAVWFSVSNYDNRSPHQRRNTTAWDTDNINSNVPGRVGGWN